jgi:hypothetical protein
MAPRPAAAVGLGPKLELWLVEVGFEAPVAVPVVVEAGGAEVVESVPVAVVVAEVSAGPDDDVVLVQVTALGTDTPTAPQICYRKAC